ncbi:Sua5/YciO/YrdC/YwlC family protein, partial [Thiotrichales bacterium HSG1]|nr:Sua5/YciO/YrdC/YwlC family protein [Thiotrichales bacterium HSG1]
GVRVRNNAIVQLLLDILGEPIMSSTLIMPNKNMPETEPDEIKKLLEKQVDLIIDGGHCGLEPTTVIDIMAEPPQVLRYGKGSVEATKIE